MTDWSEAPLADLCEHIVSVHHVRTREALPRLSAALEADPSLREASAIFEELRVEVEAHMLDEEERLFPAVAALDRHEVDDFPLEEIEAFEAHHLRTNAAIRELRGLIGADGAARELLDELDRDLHTHLHEENEVLFPRALAVLGRAYS
jgi:regulator of cell morphogenesis and NO signaling